jgi:hypothetical protein
MLTKDRGRSKDPHDTTKWYRVEGVEEGKQGSIGFITSMSRYIEPNHSFSSLFSLQLFSHHSLSLRSYSHFCGGCNRLRITADGKLKVCLFGNEEFNLLTAIRGKFHLLSTDMNLFTCAYFILFCVLRRFF